MSDVPRRAVFDDLRVGQWVSACDGISLWGGRIESKESMAAYVSDGDDGNRMGVLTPMVVERGEVTILRDAVAPPVTVRRELLDELRRGYVDQPAAVLAGHVARFLAAVDADTEEAAPTCGAYNRAGDARCTLSPGHVGYHDSGAWTWKP